MSSKAKFRYKLNYTTMIDGQELWHRDYREGPAVIHKDNSQMYYWRGKLHNENGPALIQPDSGDPEDCGLSDRMWYIHGEWLKTVYNDGTCSIGCKVGGRIKLPDGRIFTYDKIKALP